MQPPPTRVEQAAAGVLAVVVGATMVSDAPAWTMLAGGVIIVGALWDTLSNSPADDKRERPMPPGAGGTYG